MDSNTHTIFMNLEKLLRSIKYKDIILRKRVLRLDTLQPRMRNPAPAATETRMEVNREET